MSKVRQKTRNVQDIRQSIDNIKMMLEAISAVRSNPTAQVLASAKELASAIRAAYTLPDRNTDM